MSGYDYPYITRYNFGVDDYGAGANTLHYIKGPKGKKGTLWDYGVIDATEAFAAGTTLPMISVGTVADPDAYGDEFSLGTLAINAGGSSVRTAYRPGDAAFSTYILNNGEIPADTVIMVTCVAGTGSGLTGQAKTIVDIRWDV